MIDIQYLRDHTDEAKKALARKKVDPKAVDRFLRVDQNWRAKRAALDTLQAEQKIVSRSFVGGKKEEFASKAQILKRRVGEVAEGLAEVEKKRDALLELFPNTPFPDVPDGTGASENRVLREVGEKPTFDFKPKDSLELAERLGIIDVKRAAAVSGSRFGYLLRDGALLEFALVHLAFDVLLEHGFTPVVPPVMIRPAVFTGMGRLAADQKEERYYLAKDDLYLAGSAEHTLGPLHMDEVLDEGTLPRRYAGFSTCFRREAGSYGKDTKGILRVHQFDKVEMFSFTSPADSEKELRFLVDRQEELMQKLELPYRVVEVCTGDMGWTDARQFDIETWIPSEGAYRETQSASNTTDFQSRGVNVKITTKRGEKVFAHMLNATAFAIGRTLIAIIENYQTKKGTVRVPKALQAYLGKKEIGA
ncbi:MAG: serine--tRNA ligase [Candidatus Jorgensenbacteria bacterium]|nr:serine--tRNA ligase [Candidatus Jorgensenbacteria bacterium]